MSTLEPSDDDAVFRALTEGIEFEEQVAVVIDVSRLNEAELSDLFNETRDKIMELGEMLAPTTDEGRRLHSVRSACLIEMSKRGMR